MKHVGFRILDLLAILEPLDLRLGLGNCAAGDVKTCITRSLDNLRLELSDDLGSLINFNLDAGRRSLTKIIGWLAVILSSIAQPD